MASLRERLISTGVIEDQLEIVEHISALHDVQDIVSEATDEFVQGLPQLAWAASAWGPSVALGVHPSDLGERAAVNAVVADFGLGTY